MPHNNKAAAELYSTLYSSTQLPAHMTADGRVPLKLAPNVLEADEHNALLVLLFLFGLMAWFVRLSLLCYDYFALRHAHDKHLVHIPHPPCYISHLNSCIQSSPSPPWPSDLQNLLLFAICSPSLLTKKCNR